MSIFLDVVRWVVAIPAGLLFLLCILGNWSLIIGAVLGYVKSFSLVLPFLGPLFGIIWFLTVPIEGVATYWWLAALIEPTWLLGGWCILTWPFANTQRQADSAAPPSPPDHPRE